MPQRITLIAGAALVLVLVAVAAVAGWRWWQETDRTELQEAIVLAPQDAERFSWTDWAGVRTALDSLVGADSSPEEVATFLAEGFEADLTSNSALVESAETLQAQYGFSPASADWELLSQSRAGEVIILRMPESVDFTDLADRLTRLGYTEPSSETGVWLGGEDLVAQIGGLTPVLGFVALDAEERLVRASDSEAYLEIALEVDEVVDEGLDDVVGASGGAPVSAAVYAGDVACQSLAMSQADQIDQDQADRLLESAGKINPLTGFAFSAQPGGSLRVALSFESEDQARANADSRAVLAAGPAPGQGGDFSDRFAVNRVRADGRVVTMDLDPVENAYALSDLSNGPLLFATC